jgi:hypothetical protein
MRSVWSKLHKRYKNIHLNSATGYITLPPS